MPYLISEKMYYLPMHVDSFDNLGGSQVNLNPWKLIKIHVLGGINSLG